jgi:hypothetical protein
VGEGDQTSTAEGVTCKESDGWEREVEDRGEEGVEAIAVGKGIDVCFIKLETLYFRCRPSEKT